VLDLCGKFALDEQDQIVLEQYRPYIVMMNTRAQASIESGEKRFADALRTIDKGLGEIKDFFERFAPDDASFAEANEVRVLKRLAREIRKKVPVNPLERLERRLEKAVREERYEDAAELRDRITHMKSRQASKL
jgi:protein-arginine kinase activator protein McsA